MPHDGDEDEHRLDTFNKLEDESISDIVSQDSKLTEEEEEKEVEATEIKTFNRSQSDLAPAPEVHLDHDHLQIRHSVSGMQLGTGPILPNPVEEIKTSSGSGKNSSSNRGQKSTGGGRSPNTKAKKGGAKKKKKLSHAEKYGHKIKNKYFTNLSKIQETNNSSESEEEEQKQQPAAQQQQQQQKQTIPKKQSK